MATSEDAAVRIMHGLAPLMATTTKRRDKRRHVATPASPGGVATRKARNNNPPTWRWVLEQLQYNHTSGSRHKNDHQNNIAFDILDLAIRLDESWQQESLLQYPLETGRLHDSPIKFWKAYCYLEQKTKPPDTIASSSSAGKRHKNPLSSSSEDAFLFADDTTGEATRAAQEHGTARRQHHEFLEDHSDTSVDDNYAGDEPIRELNQMFDGLPLTPIILSGLLTALQDQRGRLTASAVDGGTDEDNNDGGKEQQDIIDDLTPELVLYCHNMRRAAIRRIRNKRNQQQLQRTILPAASFCMLLVIYFMSVTDLKRVLEDLRFVDSCEDTNVVEASYFETCRLSNAMLWASYKDYLHTLHDKKCNMTAYMRSWDDRSYRRYEINTDSHAGGEGPKKIDNSCGHTLLNGRFSESPFALHSAWKRELITLEELDGGPQQRMVHTKGGRYSWLSESLVHAVMWGKSRDLSIPELDILDVGCGVGGSLYYFLPQDVDDDQNARTFSYTGITISKAEVHFAESLARYHGILNDTDEDDHQGPIRFMQKSFDDVLPPEYYSLVLAFESLSYSTDLRFTIRNILSAMKPRAMLLIADEMIEQPAWDTPSFQKPKHQKSFLYFSEWSDILESEGCEVQFLRDLSMDYEMSDVAQRAAAKTSHSQYTWWDGLLSLVKPDDELTEMQIGTREILEAMKYKKHLHDTGQSSYLLLACQKISP
mmetsp:Transcript_18999/g.44625  ORF Transcript_18999/g.44625 Transcript_18999/m.44625 type:complete len:709 (+) Transcript_18999:44-2170(+)